MIAALILAIIIVVNAAVSVFFIRQNTIYERSKQLENLTQILSAHTTQIIFSAETALDSIMDVVELAKLENEKQFRNFATKQDQYDLLVEKTRSNPIIDVSTFVASDGKVLSFSRSFPPPDINLSDRDYFQWLSKNNSLRTFYSLPVQNKGNGKWVFYLARRVNGANNQFLGVVLVGVSAEVFSALYEQIGENLGQGASVSLYRSDKTLLTRWPFVDDMIGTINVNGVIDRSIDNPAGSGRVIHTSGPRFYERDLRVDRMISFRKVSNYPFITGASFTEDFYLGHLFQSAGGVIYSSLFSLFILFVSMVLLLRAYNTNTKVKFQAYHDYLTGLPNRVLLADRAQLMFSLARRHHKKLALIYIDLDHFKKINDEMSHAVGDEALKIAAEKMLSCVRDADTVSRIGGDEFIVLLSEIRDEQAAVIVAEKIQHALAQTITIGSQAFTIEASCGIAIYPDHGTTLHELQKHADLAMYASKDKGRNHIQLFNQDMNESASL